MNKNTRWVIKQLFHAFVCKSQNYRSLGAVDDLKHCCPRPCTGALPTAATDFSVYGLTYQKWTSESSNENKIIYILSAEDLTCIEVAIQPLSIHEKMIDSLIKVRFNGPINATKFMSGRFSTKRKNREKDKKRTKKKNKKNTHPALAAGKARP